MNSAERTCNLRQIDDYLDELLTESDQYEFEHHLGNCSYCQIEIQRRAADPQTWSDAIALLTTDHAPDSLGGHNLPLSNRKTPPYLESLLDSLAPSDDPEMLGRIDDYEISGVVGVGGMGAVLKGFDRSLQRVVAIKVLAPHLAGSGSARTRFHREARAAAAITHNNVIDTYGVSEANGLPYIVMPFARGHSLQSRIDRGGPLSTVEVTRIGHQIASGLAAAHEQGLVHRDIKPANILLNEGVERLWITDFGVARALDEASMTQTGMIAGTPQYMSPEQARGESVDCRSDLFSLGSVLYTASTGHPPFRSEAAYGILRRIIETEPRPIREFNPEIPQWLCQIIQGLMAKLPVQRYQSASEVSDLLEGCLAHLQQPTQIGLPEVALPQSSTPDHSMNPMPFRSPSDSPAPREQTITPESTPEQRGYFFALTRSLRVGVWTLIAFAMIFGVGVLATQLTEPTPIAGRWSGETWQDIALSSVQDVNGWYHGTFVDAQGQPGALQLEWSRLQRRYNGRWKIGDDSGSLTLRRLSNSELRGAVAADTDANLAADIPRLRDFSWSPAPNTPPVSPKTAMAKVQVPILAPFEGHILRLGPGIRENLYVQSGTLIAQFATVSAEEQAMLLTEEASLKLQLEAALNTVEACKNLLETSKSNVATLNLLDAYQDMHTQAAAASDAALAAAQKRVEAAQAALAGEQNALDQANQELKRKSALFKENFISQAQFDVAQREVESAKVRVVQAEANVAATEQSLQVYRSDKLAKQAKAKADVDHQRARLQAAKSAMARAEEDLAKAELQLANREKTASELAAKRAAIKIIEITAPTDGVLTQLALTNALQRDQVVCLVTPNARRDTHLSTGEGAANGHDWDIQSNPTVPVEAGAGIQSPKSKMLTPMQLMGVQSGSELGSDLGDALGRSHEMRSHDPSAPAGTPFFITQRIESVLSFMQRRLALQGRLRQTIESKADSALVSALEEQMDSTEKERLATISILETQLESAKDLYVTQSELRKHMQRRVDAGELGQPSLLHVERNLLRSSATIQQLEILLAFYGKLDDPSPNSDLAAERLVSEILEIQLSAQEELSKVFAEQAKIARSRFEAGMCKIDELLMAEQSRSHATSDLKVLQALLSYYSSNSPAKTASDESDSSPDTQPSNPSERERATVQAILAARLEAAENELEVSQQNLKLQEQLFQNQLVSELRVEEAQLAVSRAEATLKTLQKHLDNHAASETPARDP